MVLPASAFVLERPEHGSLLPSLAVAMALVERRRGSWKTAGLFAAGHVGATLVVAGGLLTGIRVGVVDPAWRRALDVGVSYGELALVAELQSQLPPGWRRAFVAGTTAALLAAWAVRREPVDGGHLAAWLIGLAVVSRAWPVDAPGSLATPPQGC